MVVHGTSEIALTLRAPLPASMVAPPTDLAARSSRQRRRPGQLGSGRWRSALRRPYGTSHAPLADTASARSSFVPLGSRMGLSRVVQRS